MSEIEKLRCLGQSKTQIVQEFLDWLLEVKKFSGHDHEGNPIECPARITYDTHLLAARYRTHDDWVPHTDNAIKGENSRMELMAEFFGIDLKKLEDERTEMLEELSKNG